MYTLDFGILQNNAKAIIVNAIPLIQKQNNKGGYLCITNNTGLIICVMLIGEFSHQSDANNCLKFSQEKALRLGAHENQISAWQSRVYNDKQFGGAIRAGQFILSFSGFPEHWDEICMIILARSCGLDMDDGMISRIVAISENPLHWQELIP